MLMFRRKTELKIKQIREWICREKYPEYIRGKQGVTGRVHFAAMFRSISTQME